MFDLEWLEREDKILSGSGDQTIVLHDVPTGDKLETFRGHDSSINSISARVGDDGLYFLNSYFFFNKISCYFDDSVLCGLMVFTTSYYLLYFFRKKLRVQQSGRFSRDATWGLTLDTLGFSFNF